VAGIKGRGWIAFAGIMLMLVGFFNVIGGLSAIDKNYAVLNDNVLFSNLETWGWFFLIWGIIQVLAGFAILGGKTWGAVVGIAVAFLNAIAQLAWLNTNSTWAFIAILIDVLIIYALAVYGGDPEIAG
jgi:hypothetical protein